MSVVDGDDVAASEDPFSMEQFLKALQEETAANAEFFGDNDPNVRSFNCFPCCDCDFIFSGCRGEQGV